MAYIGSSPTKVVSRQSANIFTYTATANQTAFTGSDANGNTLACSPSDIMVHMNGIKLEESDYTASTTTVTLGSGAAAGDEVTITAFVTFESADHYNKSTADTRYVNATGDTMTGALTGTSAGFTGDVNIGNNASSNPLSKLRLGGTQYGAADIRPTDEGGHKVGMAFYTDGTGDTTIDPVLRMTIDSSGIVTKPNNPSFHAGISAHDTRSSGYYNHSTGSGWVTVHNTGNHFSSGTFTAPVAGVYQFNVTLAANYGDVHVQYWNVVFEKNGSGYIGQNWDGWRSGQSTYKSINNQCTISLAANDYVRVKSECSTTLQTLGSGSAANSIFSGFLIG